MKYGKQILCVALAVLLGALPLTAAAGYDLPSDMEVSARGAMVVYLEPTAATGAEGLARDLILYEKEADTTFDPAATVRVMVGLYAMKLIEEHGVDIDTATGTYTSMLEQNYVWGTGMSLANMEVGETWTVRDLLSLSMIQTAADACVTLAYTLAGGVDRFVLGMNRYAAEIGCTHTGFVNVHGLDDPRQYTTPHDLYVMMRYALEYPLLERLMGLTEYTVVPVSGGYERSWENTNYMLRSSSDYYYSPLTLGKTGVSDVDGANLVSVAEDSGYRYLTVVLGCPADEGGSHYQNSAALYRWAFNHFTYKTVIAKNQPVDRLPVTLSWDTDTVSLVAKDPLACLVADEVDEESIRMVVTPFYEAVQAPVEKGAVLGKAELFIRLDEKLGEVELVAGEGVPRSEILHIWDGITGLFSSPVFWFSAAALLALIIVLLLWSLIRTYRKRQRRLHSKRR